VQADGLGLGWGSLTAMPKVVEAMRRVVIIVKRMMAMCVLFDGGVDQELRCQDIGVWFLVNKISRT
jgi:hypothetical protein